MLSYPQAVVIGLLQGVTELFPISSLGHSEPAIAPSVAPDAREGRRPSRGR
jgi:hypothetical protein